jgi:hypothetical protein
MMRGLVQEIVGEIDDRLAAQVDEGNAGTRGERERDEAGLGEGQNEPRSPADLRARLRPRGVHARERAAEGSRGALRSSRVGRRAKPRALGAKRRSDDDLRPGDARSLSERAAAVDQPGRAGQRHLARRETFLRIARIAALRARVRVVRVGARAGGGRGCDRRLTRGRRGHRRDHRAPLRFPVSCSPLSRHQPRARLERGALDGQGPLANAHARDADSAPRSRAAAAPRARARGASRRSRSSRRAPRSSGPKTSRRAPPEPLGRLSRRTTSRSAGARAPLEKAARRRRVRPREALGLQTGRGGRTNAGDPGVHPSSSGKGLFRRSREREDRAGRAAAGRPSSASCWRSCSRSRRTPATRRTC